jgi:hypothetical protein
VCVSKLLKTPYYRSFSHKVCLNKAPLGANESCRGADTPRDLAGPNRLCVARDKVVFQKELSKRG